MDPSARRPGGFGRRSGMGKHKHISWINEKVMDVVREMHWLASNTRRNARRGKYETERERRIRNAVTGIVHEFANRVERADDRMLKKIGETAMDGFLRSTIYSKDMALIEIARLCGMRVGNKMGVEK